MESEQKRLEKEAKIAEARKREEEILAEQRRKFQEKEYLAEQQRIKFEERRSAQKAAQAQAAYEKS